MSDVNFELLCNSLIQKSQFKAPHATSYAHTPAAYTSTDSLAMENTRLVFQIELEQSLNLGNSSMP